MSYGHWPCPMAIEHVLWTVKHALWLIDGVTRARRSEGGSQASGLRPQAPRRLLPLNNVYNQCPKQNKSMMKRTTLWAKQTTGWFSQITRCHPVIVCLFPSMPSWELCAHCFLHNYFIERQSCSILFNNIRGSHIGRPRSCLQIWSAAWPSIFCFAYVIIRSAPWIRNFKYRVTSHRARSIAVEHAVSNMFYGHTWCSTANR